MTNADCVVVRYEKSFQSSVQNVNRVVIDSSDDDSAWSGLCTACGFEKLT